MHKSPQTIPSVHPSVPTVHGMPSAKRGMTSGTGSRAPTQTISSFKITSSMDEETEEEDTLLNNEEN
jgi:hypothetical protein